MRNLLTIALLASALAAPVAAKPRKDEPARGVESVNVPVVTRSDYVFDAAAPGGQLPPSEQARLDGWFGGLGLGYGDRVYVEGAYADGARADVARVAGRYGLLLSQGAPMVAGAASDGNVRVIVSRTRASVPGCPRWEPSSPTWGSETMSNYGCGVNGNLAAMVADPQDLVWGREAGAVVDASVGNRAIQMYRNAIPTGQGGLKEISTKDKK